MTCEREKDYNNISKSAVKWDYCRNDNQGDAMPDKKYQLQYLQDMCYVSSFNRADLLQAMENRGMHISQSMFKVTLQKLLNQGLIARVGRNAYCVADQNVQTYRYEYSDLAHEVVDQIKGNHPFLDFTVFELIQLNEFLNHQLAHNIIFVSVESDLGDFVFDTLKEKYPGKVLIYPTVEVFHRYWYDDMIVIQKLVSEAPMGQQECWHTRLEKLLVDVLTDNLLAQSVSEAEWSGIYEGVFQKYAVDESCLFRYAKRRGAEKKIRDFVREKTTVRLRLEKNDAVEGKLYRNAYQRIAESLQT